MPAPLRNPDGLFPSDRVVRTLWSDLPSSEINAEGPPPGWAAMPPRPPTADHFTLVDAILGQIAPLISALSAAGWQVQSINATASGNPDDTLAITVADRIGGFSLFEIPNDTRSSDTLLIVQLVARPVPVPQGVAHAVMLNGSGPDWGVLSSDAGLELTLTESGPATGSVQVALAALGFAIGNAMQFVTDQLGPRYGQISSAGLGWMMNPANWFAAGGGPETNAPDHIEIDDVIERNFLELVVEAAQKVVGAVYEDTGNSSSDNTGADLTTRQVMDGTSLFDEFRKVDPVAATNVLYQQRAMERVVREEGGDDLDARLRLVTAIRSASFFDFCCMLVSAGLINPPLLNAPPVEVLQEIEAGDLEPLGFVTGTASGTDKGTAITLILYGEPCVTLRQLPGGSGPVPHILDNAAWELTGLLNSAPAAARDDLGLPADAAFGIALTLGRGVSVIELDCALPYELDIYWTQTPSTIPLPQSAPVDLEGNAGLAPGDAGYESVDLCARGALNLHLQRMPVVIEGFVPEGVTLENFSRQSPPMLVMSQMEQGAVKFEWFARGGSGPPGEPEPNLGESPAYGVPPVETYHLPPPEEGLEQDLPDPPVPPSEATPQGAPEITVIVTPRNPKGGDFGFAMSIDYVRHTGTDLSVPFYLELGVDEPLPWSVGFMHPGLMPLVAGSQLAGGMLSLDVVDTDYDRGVAHFRLWFAGDVQIDISANAWLNRQFQMELVKVPEVLDLPENGTRLPCRRGYLEARPNALYRGVKSYSTMLDPEETDLPRWMEPENVSDAGIAVPLVRDTQASQVIFGSGFTQVQPLWTDAEWVICEPGYFAQHGVGPHPYGGRQVYFLPGMISIPVHGLDYLQMYVDVVLGFCPVVGDVADVAEFLWALYSGKDKWGNPQPTWVIALMGVGAMCPLISNGMLKGVRQIGGAAVVGGTAVYLTTYQEGRKPPDLAKLWSGVLRTSDDAAQIGRLGEEVGTKAFRDMSRAEKAQALADAVPLSELKAIATRAGVTVGELFSEARMTFGMLLHPTMVDEVGDFVFAIDGMEVAYKIWRDARVGRSPPVPLTRLAFIEARKTSSGKWAAVAKAFNVPQAMPFKRVRNVNPARGPRWPGRPEGVFDSFVTRPKAQIATRLKQAGAVGDLLGTLPEGSRAIVGKYQAELTEFLSRKTLAELEQMFSTSSELSTEEVLSVLGHMMQKADNAAREAKATLAMRNGVAEVTEKLPEIMDDLPDLIDDLFKSAVARSGYEHGSVFEVFGSIIYLRHYAKKPVAHLAMQVALKAGDTKSGPDLIEFFVDGFGIVQFKSYSALGALLGTGGVRDNTKQMITDLARMYDPDVGPGVFKLPVESVPAPVRAAFELLGDPNAHRLYNGDYLSVINLRQFRDLGDDGLQALFNMTGGRYDFHLEDYTGLDPAKLRLLGDYDEAAGVLTVHSADAARSVAREIGDDPAHLFVDFLEEAKEFQAFDMTDTLPFFNTRAVLQAEMDINPRMVTFVSSIIDGTEKAKKAGVKDAAKFVRENGVELFFNRYGPNGGSLPDGWLTKPDGDMFEINPRVMGMEAGYLEGW
jgi:hypothetical protein